MRMCSQVSPRGAKRGVHRSRRLDENARMGCIKKKNLLPVGHAGVFALFSAHL